MPESGGYVSPEYLGQAARWARAPELRSYEPMRRTASRIHARRASPPGSARASPPVARVDAYTGAGTEVPRFSAQAPFTQ